MIRINPPSTKSDSSDRNEWTQNSQIYSKITIHIGIWHIYYPLKIPHILSNPTGIYLFTLDYRASQDTHLAFPLLSLDPLSFPVTGPHPSRLSLYSPPSSFFLRYSFHFLLLAASLDILSLPLYLIGTLLSAL